MEVKQRAKALVDGEAREPRELIRSPECLISREISPGS